MCGKVTRLVLITAVYGLLQIYNSRLAYSIHRQRQKQRKKLFRLPNSLLNDAKVKTQIDRTQDLQEDKKQNLQKNKKQNLQKDKKQDLMKDIDNGLWLGRHYDGETADPHNKDIHVIISHCSQNLKWVTDFVQGYNISSIHIISKCGLPVDDAPEGSTIERMINVGRNDHTYAHYITSILDSKIVEMKSDEDNSIVVFMKDKKAAEQNGIELSNFNDMITAAASNRGFGCLSISQRGINGVRRWRYYSAYHITAYLRTFAIDKYEYKGFSPAGSNETQFISAYDSLGHMVDSLNIKTQDIVQVCYNGFFAASVSNIKKINEITWNNIEAVLSRGDNIQEGHFMERLWGALLSTPLTRSETETLIKHSKSVYLMSCCYNGVLTMK